ASTVQRWKVEVHQFRIEASVDAPGLPTPEGMHRDGVDYVLVLLVKRSNIASGTTMIGSLDGSLSSSFTLIEPFDAALVDDARACHGVTPVEPLLLSMPAYRDVLVVTFRKD
ncbi:MAG: 2OG-Fe dioxygenase family protein, partial [Arenimonas sp.]